MSCVAASALWGAWLWPLPASAALLHFEVVQTNIVLTWPSNSVPERLQGTGCGQFMAWTNVAVAPGFHDGSFRVTLPMIGQCAFYRLAGRDLNHVLIVGQSLALGAGGVPLLSTNKSPQHKMFVGQRLCSGAPEDLSALIPLIERQDPVDLCGETIASGFASFISARTQPGEHDLLLSNCGQGGTAYEGLKRLPSGAPSLAPTGTVAYLRGMNQVTAARQLAAPQEYAFRAIFSVHGEGDAPNPAYDTDIRQWQADFQTDIQALTGSSGLIPMFHSQFSAWGLNANRGGFSSFLMLQEHEVNPWNTLLVCPKYMLPYADGLHLTATGYRWLGEYYAKAYDQVVLRGQPWSPLRPLTLTRSNNVIDLTFTGAVGPLILDTNLVSDPAGDVSDCTAGPCGACLRVAANPDTDEFTYVGHTFAVGDTVIFYHTNLPVGVDFRRYWITAIPHPDRFKISTEPGGPTLNITNAGDEVVMYWPATTRVGPYGFEFYDSDGSGVPWRSATWVTKAEVTGPVTVRVTLNRAPTGHIRQLRYAYSVSVPSWGGPHTGPRGCLRDSDPTASLHGHPLYNWCVHFDKPCP